MGIAIAIMIVFFMGLVAGYLLPKPESIDKPIGDLRVDQSDPYDGPYLFLELHTTPNFKNLDKVTLNVKLENYISHE